MKTFHLTITFDVEARDHDEAVDVSMEVCSVLGTETSYKLTNIETSRIEEEK